MFCIELYSIVTFKKIIWNHIAHNLCCFCGIWHHTVFSGPYNTYVLSRDILVLNYVAKVPSVFQQNQIADIIPAILSAEVVIASSNDWRLQETIVEHFRCFQYLTNSDNIFNKIIPVLFNKLRRAVSVFSPLCRLILE